MSSVLLRRRADLELARLHQARLKVVFDDGQTRTLDRDIELYTDAVSKVGGFADCP
jgi:hypothetical protein